MRQSAVAVLDIGKTNAKILAIDPDGTVHASHQVAVPAGGDGTLDSEGVWNWIQTGLRRLAARFDLSAIVPTAHGAAAALVDDAGLVHPVIDYEAIPPAAIDAAYDALRPGFSETFSPRLPAGLNLGRQLYWIQRTNPDALARAQAVLTYPQYFAWRLTGTMASEVTSLGCHSDLWRPESAALSSLVDRMGWHRLFAPLRGAQARLGQPRPMLDLPSCDVLCGIHDSNAAYLGYLAGATGPFAVVSTGTWVVCFNGQGRLAQLDPGRDTLANVDASGTAVACSRFMGGREYAAILGLAGVATAAPTPTRTALAAVVARGEMALPSFAETGGPFPDRVGEIIGELATPQEAACVATLYLALMTREALDLTGPAARIFVDGAFVANPLYAPLLATLMPDREVFVSRRSDGTATGAAILARWTDAALPRVALDAERVIALGIDLDIYARTWRARAMERKDHGA